MKKKYLFFLTTIGLALTLISCASTPPATDLELVFKRIPDNKYKKLIAQNTQNDKQYEGLYNIYEAYATLLNAETQEALLQREGYYMQWDMTKAQTERERSIQKRSTSTQFYLSLFTPKNQHNDLHKLASMWKVFLEVDGIRYQGKVERFPKNLEQIKNLFPHHSRFNRGYIVNFAIPLSQVENQKSVFILTSTLGTSTFKF